MADAQRVIVTGATGLIGKRLCPALRRRGYAVVVFSRNPEGARAAVPGAAEYVAWRPEESGAWAARVDGAHAVISLAGANIAGKRWTEAYKREVRDSRVVGIRGLVNAMRTAQRKPAVFIQGSAVGYYGPRDDTPLDESAPPGNDFAAGVQRAVEAEAAKAGDLGVRTVLVRTAVVLDKDEGALVPMRIQFALFAGGPILPGSQWFSWIHPADEVGILLLALEDERVRGPINAAAPQPQTNRDFTRTLGRVMGRPSWAPVPGFAIRLLKGQVAEMLTTGQRVIPRKALELGYQFQYPRSEDALRQILK